MVKAASDVRHKPRGNVKEREDLDMRVFHRAPGGFGLRS